MQTNPNARLKERGQERLARRHMDDGMPLAELAAQAGISLRTADHWLARYPSAGVTALVVRHTIDPQQRLRGLRTHVSSL